jgi:hypothetical protein
MRFSETTEIKTIVTGEPWKLRNCYLSLLAQIPKDAPVYVQNPLASHLSQRPFYFYYDKAEDVAMPHAWVAVPRRTALPPNALSITASCGYKIAQY